MIPEDALEPPPPAAPAGAGRGAAPVDARRGSGPARLLLVCALAAAAGASVAAASGASPAGASAAEEAPPEPTPRAEGTEGDPAPAPTLEAFMEGMAQTSGVQARFREVKELGLLSTPLEVEGHLTFVPPDRLARVTTEPSRTRLVIDGDRFGFRDEAGEETIDLSSNPMAREFVESFIVLFGGDPEALRARYEPELHVEGQSWRLVLRPRGRALASVVERVVLSGEGRKLRRMELLEADGDRTTTYLEEVRVDRRFDEAELERLFAMPGGAGGERDEAAGEAAGEGGGAEGAADAP